MDTSLLRDKRVVVSGGLGFIGSNLVRKLSSCGAWVTVVDNRLARHGANDFNLEGYQDKVRIAIRDVRSPDFFKFLDEAEIYFNLAAQTSHIGSMLNPFEDTDINARAQLVLLEHCRKYNPAIRIVFTSTRQVYGKPQYLPVDELHPLRPVDINGVNKMAAENFFRLYSEVYGIKTSILRLTNTYGPRMKLGNSLQTFLGAWLRNLLDGRPIEIWDGKVERDFCYVDDAVDALLAVAVHESAVGEVFNLGGERSSLRDLARRLIDYWGRGEIVFTPYPADRIRIEIGNIYSNDQKIRDCLGWRPQVSLENGLKATLEYYRKHMQEYCW
jgi:UDP-glucose 4-epimerase